MTKIIPQRKNANRHTQRGMGMLEASIQQDGIIGAMTVAADGETFDGSARGEVLPAVGFDLNDVSQVVKAEPGRALIIESDGSSPLVHRRTDIPSADDPRARRLGVAANRIASVNLSWEPDVLAELNGAVDLSGMFFPDELAAVAQPIDAADDALDAEPDDDAPAVEAPNLLFPSDNEWGVPTLDLKHQARALVLPCLRWGRAGRSSQMNGTYHFYTDDYKFSALWDDPTPLIFCGCKAIIEPNVSTNAAMPPAVALWGVYRKRWIARWAQSYGVDVFVDLNVEPQFAELNLLGVPRGWRSYATRGYDTRAELLDADYQTACTHAETDDIVFVVVGGGQATHAACMARGWVHVPQENHVIEGRRYIDG